MFRDCPSLQFGNNISNTYLHTPTITGGGTNMFQDMFRDCTILNGAGFPDSPTANQDYSIFRN
ncbi:MAG: hypothetical protein LBD05_02740 [Mycoplasmataceae bacterium]|jgi:hypothetical protein|nr:hypothetical protein [Mycoplasmataceae bacterium]